MHIVRLGLRADHDHVFLVDLGPAPRPGIRVQKWICPTAAPGETLSPFGRIQSPLAWRHVLHRGIKLGVQEEVDMFRLGTRLAASVPAWIRPSLNHLDRDGENRRLSCALGVPRLQHPQLSAFDRELDILGLPRWCFSNLADRPAANCA